MGKQLLHIIIIFLDLAEEKEKKKKTQKSN